MRTAEATTRRPGAGSDRRRGWRSYQEERQLHRRLCARDERALLDCLDRFGPLVFRALCQRTGDRARAEALTEALFARLWKDPAAFAPERGPMAFQLLQHERGGRQR